MTEMITDPATAVGRELGAQQRRVEARRMYRESVAAELPVTAEALGRTFGRSIRWGRDRIAEVRAEDATLPGEHRMQPGQRPDPGMPPGEAGMQRGEAGMPPEDRRVTAAGADAPPGSRQPPPGAAGMPRVSPAAARGKAGRRPAAAAGLVGMPVAWPDSHGRGLVMTGRRRFLVTALGVLAGVVAGVGTLAVAAAGFTLSFDAIRAVGQAAFIRPSLTWMLPVCVDGAMSVASVCAVVLRRMGRGNAYPWLVVLAGAGISIAANALHAYQQGGAVPLPPQWAMAVSAVPPLLLAMSIHLLVILAVALRELGRP